jgi:hypothetical protein
VDNGAIYANIRACVSDRPFMIGAALLLFLKHVRKYFSLKRSGSYKGERRAFVRNRPPQHGKTTYCHMLILSIHQSTINMVDSC